MKVRALVVVAASVIAGGAAWAGPERVLRCEAVIDATPAQLWEAYTTKAGWESWAVPVAEVDFRVGGTIRTNYNREAGIGGPGTITHHIVAYEPERMVATHFTSEGNAAWAKKAEACQVVVRLEPVSEGRTRFTETMVGWGEGPEWDDSYEHFKQGNEWTLERLKKRFARAEGGDAAADEALRLMASMVGGEWIREGKAPDGSTFRVRNVVELAPDGKGTVTRGWLGGKDGMFPHGCTQVWKEGGEARFQSLDQDGAVARGTLRVRGERTLIWEWTEVRGDGTTARYTVEHTFDGPDAYRMRLLRTGEDGKEQELVNIPLHRVARAPAEFLRMKGGRVSATIDAGLFPAAGMVEGLTKEVVVKASAKQAFESWATGEGIKGFLGCESNIELRVGGAYEIYFGGPEVPAADRGSNGCQVLAYVPGEMLAFSWNAPPKFPAERAQRAWVVLTFTPVEPGQTRVRLVHTGFGEDGQWPQVREYFDSAWPRVLEELKKHYEQ